MNVMLFDTETTGLVSNRSIKLDKQPRIIDFYGCVADLKTGKIKEEIDELINPGIKISDEITGITGITNEMVKASPSFEKVKPRIVKMIKSVNLIIGHNIRFDSEIVDNELKRLNENIDWPRLVCTVEQTVHLTGARLSLERLHQFLFNETFSGAHRAKTDVMANLRCAVELFKRGII